MPDKETVELSLRQLKRAADITGFIPAYIDIGDYNGAVNRAYYAVFHAIKAVELLDNYDSKKHSGLIARFRQEYIKTGIIDVKYSDMIQDLSQFRNDSDYNILAVITLSDAQEQYANAKDFVSMIDDYIKMRLDIK
ncbi:MAG: HEPN domain-containing protein [Clostridia bacterium]|nr:HEPN domain-containing protein [Clostridia bacterium]